jgi:hypothetical protein
MSMRRCQAVRRIPLGGWIRQLTGLGSVMVLLAGNAATQMPDGSSLADLPRLKHYSAHRASSENRYVGSNDDSKRIMPGETLVMADLNGPGVVNHIWLTVADNEYAWPRLVRLRVYYDGKKTPAVDVPLGDFFAVGHGYERNVDSLPIRDSSYGRARNSYWSMPFRKSCRITVTDEGQRAVTMFYYHVDWQQHPSLPEDVAYFHAYYRQERPAVSKKNYEFLNVKGTGHYVGTVLNVIQAGVGWFGEGDDLFFVDGAAKPQLYGTGTEDYLSDAWDLRVAMGPWSGIPIADGERIGARLSGYRWHVPDPIPFTKSLWAGIEHKGWTYNADGTARSGFEERPDYFSSVAFWYQKGVNEGLSEPPYGDERLPLGNAVQIAVEDSLADVKTQKGKATVQREVDWGKDLLLFEAEGPGSRIDVPIDIANPGRYEILARIAQAPDYGNYYALLDDKPMNVDNREALTSEIPTTGPEILQNYLSELFLAVDRPLGWLQLDQGRHTLSFICTGRDARSAGFNLGINDLVLELVPKAGSALPEAAPPSFTARVGTQPVYRGRIIAEYRRELAGATDSSRATILRSIGSFGEDAAAAAPEVGQMLADSNDEVRIAAAWALSQMGPAGARAVPALSKSLTDPNPKVRSLSAVALRCIGPKAADAVPALIQALMDPQPFVRAPAADALGHIGPSAKSAAIPLADRLLAKEEQTYVLRSVATALGDIGPDAAAALPALQQALKLQRVTGSAEEAILRITKQQVPTWF